MTEANAPQRAMAVLRWTYEPPGIFERPLQIERASYVLRIGEGEAEATADLEHFRNSDSCIAEIEADLWAHLHGAQIVRCMPVEVVGPRLHFVHADGHREFFAGVVEHATAQDFCDVQVVQDGEVISDSRADRWQAMSATADVLGTASRVAPLASRIAALYAEALADRNHELSRLYEVQEAIRAALPAGNPWTLLGMSGNRWDKLGRHANNGEIRQGRHAGQGFERQRDATAEELRESREVASEMVRAYLRLCAGTPPSP